MASVMSRDRRDEAPRPAGTAKGAGRQARLAAALRENLRRRKRQKSARKDASPPPERPAT